MNLIKPPELTSLVNIGNWLDEGLALSLCYNGKVAFTALYRFASINYT